MKKEDAIKFLQQLYPNGGHCWLDEQRIEAIGMAVKALQEEPKPKFNKGDKIQSVGKSTGHIYTFTIKEIQDDCYVLDDDKVLTFNMQDNWELVEEPVSEDLGDYINELSKQFPEVSFTKLSRIAVRVAKWQEEQFEKNRLAHCDAQTEEEAEREWNFCMSILNYEHRQPTYDDAIKYGMRLKEEQMIKDAVDAELDDVCGVLVVPVPYHNGVTGEKCKVLIIKED